MERRDQPTDTDWARLREAQTQTLGLPNTGMATIIDIGNAKDIHPKNKQDVGARLYMSAKKIVYGDDVVYSGPTCAGAEPAGHQIVVSFDHVGSGLLSMGPQVVGFAVAGEDQVYHWAQGELSGNKVILTAEKVDQPLYVRYAWADNPACNLYNNEGFPAVPFRTDNFDQE